MATRTRAEQETIIRRAADEQSWDVFSEDPKVVRKLERLHGKGLPHGHGFRWLLPASCVSFRAPSKPRPMTAEQRQAAAERLAKVRRDG